MTRDVVYVALYIIPEKSNFMVESTLRSGAWLQVSGSKTFSLIQVFFIYPSYNELQLKLGQDCIFDILFDSYVHSMHLET
jgi:hypothetical protein